MLTILLACLLVLPLVGISASAELSDDTLIPQDAAYSDSMNDDIGIAPENYLPFIYVENYPFSDVIDCSQCQPGYLYVADLATHTVTLVLEEPVSSFTETTDYLFYISQDNQIIRTDYAG